MTTFGDARRADVTALFTELEAIAMTIRTGLFTGHDAGSGRSVGTTPTDFAVTGFLVEAHHERNENRQLMKKAQVYLDGGALTTAGVTLDIGQQIIVSGFTWTVAALHPVTPDANPALWTVDVTA